MAGNVHRFVTCDDLPAEAERRIVTFAYEFHWRPKDVWALTLSEFCQLADFVDEQNERRAEMNRRAQR